MPETNPKHVFWISLSLNVVLAIMVLYSTSSGARNNLLALKFSPQATQFSKDVKNATENFIEFPIDLENATAVFNSVYGAVKHKDSDLNPVGVNFFPAYIPPNTLMYHATNRPSIPDSYEWVAMDYEFSYNFAHFPRANNHNPFGPKPGHPHKPGGPPMPGPPGRGRSRKDPPEEFETTSAPKWNPFEGPHFLYTFRNTKAFDKLIYLDGASAAKASTGEMDQQLVLSQQKDLDGYVNEGAAADRICKWGKPFGLQGVIRLEVGYEIIICDFHTDFELVSNMTLFNVTTFAGLPYEKEHNLTDVEKAESKLLDRWEDMSGFEFLRAGSVVNNGEPRILVDYSRLVTPLNKTWINPDPYLRRINKIPETVKSDIISQLETAMTRGSYPFHQTNWGQVTGRIVNKFAPFLVTFNNTLRAFEEHKEEDLALKDLADSLSALTYNFVRVFADEAEGDWVSQRPHAFERAMEDYVHNTFAITTDSERLIYSSVYRVALEVISLIFDLHDLTVEIFPRFYTEKSVEKFDTDRIVKQKERLLNLLKTLRWSVFTKCTKACQWDEICVVPTWGPDPMGLGFRSNNSTLHYEDGSYRINSELRCVSIEDLRPRA